MIKSQKRPIFDLRRSLGRGNLWRGFVWALRNPLQIKSFITFDLRLALNDTFRGKPKQGTFSVQWYEKD